MLKRTTERGDTLIEVMLAVVILSVVTLGGLAVMNKGVATAYAVLERTETRYRVSQQIELLTYIRDRYADSVATNTGVNAYPAALWTQIRSTKAGGSTAANSTAPTVCAPNANSFYVEQNPDTTYKITNYGVSNPQTTPVAGNGLWVEAVASPGAVEVSYIDFYVKACWEAVVGGQDEMITSTMRLYDR